eukprot:1683801-Prymnesium_polylepis.1
MNNISHVVHPTRGVLTQNASERVGMVALMYRDKVRRLGPTHYIYKMARPTSRSRTSTRSSSAGSATSSWTRASATVSRRAGRAATAPSFS